MAKQPLSSYMFLTISIPRHVLATPKIGNRMLGTLLLVHDFISIVLKIQLSWFSKNIKIILRYNTLYHCTEKFIFTLHNILQYYFHITGHIFFLQSVEHHSRSTKRNTIGALGGRWYQFLRLIFNLCEVYSRFLCNLYVCMYVYSRYKSHNRFCS